MNAVCSVPLTQHGSLHVAPSLRIHVVTEHYLCDVNGINNSLTPYNRPVTLSPPVQSILSCAYMYVPAAAADCCFRGIGSKTINVLPGVTWSTSGEMEKHQSQTQDSD